MNNLSCFLAAFCFTAAINGLTFAAAKSRHEDYSTATESRQHQQENNVMPQPQCGIYFAPSTVPGAGFGIFAGRDYEEDEIVTSGDLVVPIVELKWNNPDFRDNLWEKYHWAADTYVHYLCSLRWSFTTSRL
jgi:hypothetical protein